MDSRERVFLSLNHEEPDRVPMDFWATAGAWDVIAHASGMTRTDFLDTHDIDYRYIDGPEYIGKPLANGVDIWGVHRRVSVVKTPFGVERYSEVADSPLASLSSVEQIEQYDGWPDPNDFDYSVVKEQALEIRNQGRVAVFMGDRLNRVAQLKPAMYVRGVDQILLDLAIEPAIARVIIGRIAAFYEGYLTRMLEAADGQIDIVLTGDDFGQQRGLLISPEMWDEYIATGFSTYMKIIRSFEVKSMHHTCGDVRLIAPRLHNLGLDILQSLQPEAMGDSFAAMKQELGRTMSFHGGISIQRALPRGAEVDVNTEVRNRIEALSSGGGYTLCTAHNIQADCSYENIAALLDAYIEHGKYKSV